MSDSLVQLQPDSTGKKIQCFENTVSGNVVETQAVAIVGTDGVPITIQPVSISAQKGAANSSILRSTASTSAATLAIARATRRGILIRNLDASITIYVGSATVTTSNGFPILPGEGIPFSWVGLIQVIAASGTPAYAAWDEYD